MTTLQEALEKIADALPAYIDGVAAREYLAVVHAALEQQGAPAAYITDTEQGPMVWTPEMYNDACTYCDDGEFPVPLYTAAPAPQAQSNQALEKFDELQSAHGIKEVK